MELTAGDYRVVVAPQRGGSLLAFDWRGEPLMRPCNGPSIFDVACFPLVPFSNRIAHGRFAFGEHEVRLYPNFPGAVHPHPLHGFGWLSEWTVTGQDRSGVTMEHRYSAGEWPWSYVAQHDVRLDDRGLTISLAVENRSDGVMPAGLGLHPYFVRNASTVYCGLHKGEWLNDADCLPLRLDERARSIDWWNGAPVASREVDTVYMHRQGPLTIAWPDRDLELSIQPATGLPHTVVYVPTGEDYFCVEPVSHITDAFNSPRADAGTVHLEPGATFRTEVRFTAAMTMQGSTT